MVLIKADKHLLEKEASGVIEFYRNNPAIAAHQLLRLDGEPLELAPIQQVVLSEWWWGTFSILTASRGMGKTFVSAVYAALQTLLYPSTRLGIFAPAFRQSKFIFKEFERLYENSPVLNTSVAKVPTYGNDQCTCTYKPIRQGMKPSEVVALPVGSDGGKIRGSRFRKIILDEIPHLPEVIFRSAIQPMMATAVNPMKRVKEVELLKKLDPTSIIDLSDNGYIGITSGYYQFNYWWQEIIKFYEEIKNGSKLYSLRFVPYYELPEGFYDSTIVNDAEIHSPKHLFLTEWLAEWIADSEGAFPMSILELCRDERVVPKYCKDPDQDKGKEYVFGIDAARESDSSAIVVVEVGYPSKVVYIMELEDKEFPEQTKIIFELIERFKPLRIYMDEFGGGNVIRDQLARPEQVGMSKSQKIILVENATKDTGKPILDMCNFNTAFIEDININAKTLLEQRAILFPDSTHPIEMAKTGTKGSKIVDLVQEMLNQISSVVVTQTPTGRLHYDLPKKKGSLASPVTAKKDLYTAFLLACHGVYQLQWKPKSDKIGVDRGVIKERTPNYPLTQDNLDDMINNRQTSTISIDSNPNKRTIKGGGVILGRNVRRK